MIQIRQEVATISWVTKQSLQEQTALKTKIMSSLAGVDERIARVKEMLRVQADQVQADQFRQVGSLYNDPPHHQTLFLRSPRVPKSWASVSHPTLLPAGLIALAIVICNEVPPLRRA